MAKTIGASMGLGTLGKHPASSDPSHHDCAAQSAMTGIKTSVSAAENGRPYARNGATTRVVRSSVDGGRDPGGDVG